MIFEGPLHYQGLLQFETLLDEKNDVLADVIRPLHSSDGYVPNLSTREKIESRLELIKRATLPNPPLKGEDGVKLNREKEFADFRAFEERVKQSFESEIDNLRDKDDGRGRYSRERDLAELRLKELDSNRVSRETELAKLRARESSDIERRPAENTAVSAFASRCDFPSNSHFP